MIKEHLVPDAERDYWGVAFAQARAAQELARRVSRSTSSRSRTTVRAHRSSCQRDAAHSARSRSISPSPMVVPAMRVTSSPGSTLGVRSRRRSSTALASRSALPFPETTVSPCGEPLAASHAATVRLAALRTRFRRRFSFHLST